MRICGNDRVVGDRPLASVLPSPEMFWRDTITQLGCPRAPMSGLRHALQRREMHPPSAQAFDDVPISQVEGVRVSEEGMLEARARFSDPQLHLRLPAYSGSDPPALRF